MLALKENPAHLLLGTPTNQTGKINRLVDLKTYMESPGTDYRSQELINGRRISDKAAPGLEPCSAVPKLRAKQPAALMIVGRIGWTLA